MWIFIIIVVALVAGYLLAPRPNANINPGQVEAPTAEEGRPIPVLFGSRVIRGPNLVWYGNSAAVAQPADLGGGYSYYLDFHMALCHAPIDILSEILVADKKVALRDWGGAFPPVKVIIGNQSGWYLADSAGLFGGDTREGGIAGKIDYMPGGDSQTQNADLVDAIGNPLVPAFRGVVSIFATKSNTEAGFAIGKSPYMKDWSFYAIRYTSDWLPDISGIGLTEVAFSDLDPFWDDVIALVHFDAVAYDGANFYWEDVKTSNKWGKTAGTFQGVLDTTDKKYGAGSSRGGFPFDPVDGRVDNESAFNAIWIFPSGEDFTLECWLLRDQVASAADSFFLGQNGISGEMCFISRADGSIEWSGDVAPHFVRLASPPGTIVAGNWYHIAYCRASGIGRLFVNGSKVAELADPTYYDYQTGWVLNGTSFGPSSYTLIDEFRATRAARYIVDFIPNLGFDVNNPVHVDMNPAHIIRECLMNATWGMGYTEADIDDTSFGNAAYTLFNESLGMSLLWDTESTIEDFITTICKHINATVFVDRQSGKFVLKLIRQDYTIGSLPVLNTSNVTSISDYQRVQFGELVNAVTVSYWDKLIRSTATVTVQDIAAVAMQGAQISTTVKYDGFTNSTIASKVAQRDLKALSTPLISCTVYANLDAKTFGIGTCFKLTWPDYQISNMVMRVTGIGYGDGKSNRVRITCLQDVFEMPTVAFIAPTPPDGVPDTTPAQPVAYMLPYEVPYLEALQQIGKTAIDTLLTTNPSLAFVGIAAPIPQGNAIEAQLWVDDGSGYVYKAGMNFCPFAITDGAMTKVATTVDITDLVDTPVDGTWLQIDDELMEVVSLVGDTLTVRRGLLDTVPAEHADNSLIFFWDDFGMHDSTQYSDGDSVDVRLLTVTGDSVLALADGPEDTIAFAGRMARPYPPGQFKINDAYYPTLVICVLDISVTWVSRNRLTQNAKPYVGFLDATATAEVGTTYTVRARDASNPGTLIYNSTAIAGLSHTIPANSLTSVPNVILELLSVRDSLESFIAHSHAIATGAVLWTPSNLTVAPNMWLDDSTSVTNVSGAASQWNDKSGNSYHWTQATAANRPTINASGLNSLRTLQFDGTNDSLVCAVSGAFDIMRNASIGWIALVLQKPSNDGGNTVRPTFNFDTNSSTFARFAVYLGRNGTGQGNQPGILSRRLDADSISSHVVSGEASTSWRIAFFERDWGAGTSSIKLNGGTAYTQGGYTAGNTSNTASAGIRIATDGAGNFTAINVAAILVGNTALSGTELEKLEGWLAWRYNMQTNLPSGHPYRNIRPVV